MFALCWSQCFLGLNPRNLYYFKCLCGKSDLFSTESNKGMVVHVLECKDIRQERDLMERKDAFLELISHFEAEKKGIAEIK